MILIVGATGTIGSEVVKQLTNAGHRVRALARDRVKGEQILGPSVEVVAGDLSKPESLAPAFRNVDRVFVATFGGPDLAILEGEAFRASKKAGVRHVVKLSGIPVCVPEYAAQMPLAQWHVDSENELRASGVAWTILRPAFFVSNILFWNVSQRGALALPTGEGKTALLDPRDIAGVAANVLTQPGHHGRVYELTGPELLSQRDLLAKVSHVLGQRLTYVDVSPVDWRTEMVSAGFPPVLADSYLFYFDRLLKAGKMAFVRSTVADFLGRARTADDWIRDNVARLRG